jgi:Asp-tRNA(Asn)/Glu-tRNA(Gln) amidotransferase A subunit family amidase
VAAFAELVEALSDEGQGICDEVALPREFAEGLPAQLRLQHVGIARNYGPYLERHGDLLSPVLKQAIEDGRAISALEFLSAGDWAEVLRAGLDRIFERYDAIVTPAAPGEAPRDLTVTGKPSFNALWTLLGENGMPMGVQLVGRKGEDERLLRTAGWLQRSLAADAAPADRQKEARLG